MGFITHAIKDMIDPAAANQQNATDATNLAYGHTAQARQKAMQMLMQFLQANPNPAQGFGRIQGPPGGAPASVGGLGQIGGPTAAPTGPAGTSPGPGTMSPMAGGPNVGASAAGSGALGAQLLQALRQGGQLPAASPPMFPPQRGPIIRFGNR